MIDDEFVFVCKFSSSNRLQFSFVNFTQVVLIIGLSVWDFRTMSLCLCICIHRFLISFQKHSKYRSTHHTRHNWMLQEYQVHNAMQHNLSVEWCFIWAKQKQHDTKMSNQSGYCFGYVIKRIFWLQNFFPQKTYCSMHSEGNICCFQILYAFVLFEKQDGTRQRYRYWAGAIEREKERYREGEEQTRILSLACYTCE